MTRFGLMLKLYLAATGERQEDVANRIGLSVSMISLIMAGNRHPRVGVQTLLGQWMMEEVKITVSPENPKFKG